MREIRMLRSTRRVLETWRGRDGVTLADERASQSRNTNFGLNRRVSPRPYLCEAGESNLSHLLDSSNSPRAVSPQSNNDRSSPGAAGAFRRRRERNKGGIRVCPRKTLILNTDTAIGLRSGPAGWRLSVRPDDAAVSSMFLTSPRCIIGTEISDVGGGSVVAYVHVLIAPRRSAWASPRCSAHFQGPGKRPAILGIWDQSHRRVTRPAKSVASGCRECYGSRSKLGIDDDVGKSDQASSSTTHAFSISSISNKRELSEKSAQENDRRQGSRRRCVARA